MSTTRPNSRAACCPICEVGSEFIDKAVPIAGGSIYVCGQCQGYFLSPAPRIDYENSTWTKMREKQWERDVERGRIHAGRIAKWFESRCGHPLRRVLEIGCGSAYLGVGFGELGIEYEGIDVDGAIIDAAAAKGLSVHKLGAEDVASSELAPQAFDLVMSSNTFEHVTSPRAAFEALAKLDFELAAIIVPNPNGLLQRMKAWVPVRRLVQTVYGHQREIAYSIDGYWHNLAYSHGTMTYLCRQNRLKVLELHSISNYDPVFGFVQPNSSFLYRAISAPLGLLDSQSMLYLLAEHESR